MATPAAPSAGAAAARPPLSDTVKNLRFMCVALRAPRAALKALRATRAQMTRARVMRARLLCSRVWRGGGAAGAFGDDEGLARARPGGGGGMPMCSWVQLIRVAPRLASPRLPRAPPNRRQRAGAKAKQQRGKPQKKNKKKPLLKATKVAHGNQKF